ncbi:MAG: MinD/ParA family protein [Chloroflexi bacterium]|nr:MinD/ParA family protein [Chloroflexota bacterium]
MNKGRIISIHSFRGGTGKSNITANLAAQAALAGKRVGVVDADIQSPGIHVLFGLNESKMGRTLNDFLHGKCAIVEAAFAVGKNSGDAEGRAKLAGKDLWLIPSSIAGREISQVLRSGYDFNKLNEGLQTLIKELNLDYLFIDTHPGLNEETLLSIAISDIIIVILRPDDQDIQGTAVTVDVARSLDVPKMILLVNKALPKLDRADIKARFEAEFDAPVAGFMPLTFDLAENASKDLFSLSRPEHEWSLALREVAGAVLAMK